MRRIVANLPAEARLKFTPGLAWLLAGLRTYRLAHSIENTSPRSNGVSTNPSSRFFGKPVVLGCSFLLTAAGQFRFHTGFPLTFPCETSPANEPQHKVSPNPCQPKCCAFLILHSKILRNPEKHTPESVCHPERSEGSQTQAQSGSISSITTATAPTVSPTPPDTSG